MASLDHPIGFGVAPIDEDLDETAVSVDTMPASAKFDPLTQTITWTPDKTDVGAGRGSFVLRILQSNAPGARWARFDLVTFDIAVTDDNHPPPLDAPTASATVETVLTITDPGRLMLANRDWPIDRMLVQAADLYRATLPPELQATLGPNDRETMYADFLRALAATHGNPRLDPDSDEFDRSAFGSPWAWRIVAVRPRLDTSWCELRIIYQADAAEPVFAMFRLRPTWDSAALPPEARGINNAIMAQLVAKHLLDKNLGPNAKFASSAKAEMKAVTALIKAVATYTPPKPKRGQPAAAPWQRAALVAVWTEARMGGGSIRGDDGTYRSGDGWAWSVMKPLATQDDGRSQRYVDVPLPGVWADAAKSADGASWVAACPPGGTLTCSKATGLVELPGQPTVDATNRFIDLKRGELVARLPLDDGRRDFGEDSGMTCAQCHTRHFGLHDPIDPATASPAIATVPFQIIPSRTAPVWTQYLLERMKDEECRAKATLEAALGKPSALTCPLAPAP